MCPVDHCFEQNFYDFLIFLKRMLGFKKSASSLDLLQKTEATLFTSIARGQNSLARSPRSLDGL